MTKNDLPTISIQGKEYVLVKDRVLFFNENYKNYKNGAIKTEIVKYENGQVIVRAIVIPDVSSPERYFTGMSQAKEDTGYINRTAALENAETSAVGRALAMMGIGVFDSLASADEVAKTESESNQPRNPFSPHREPNAICKFCKAEAEERFGVSKRGNSYHAIFCLKNPNHIEWLTANPSQTQIIEEAQEKNIKAEVASVNEDKVVNEDNV